MKKEQLYKNIIKKKSFLCIGLDTDIKKIPEHLKGYKDPVFEFNKAIIDSTADITVCYKPNIAFYESMGSCGWDSLEKTVGHIKKNYPDIFVIADAKRGDIGNTSAMYARAFFENMDFDAVTVSPYMGSDSIKPFMTFEEKWVIILALTSNTGSEDFQQIKSNDGFMYETVIKKSSAWGNSDNIMYVVGATKAHELEKIRKIIPDHFLLIPGVGAQGGSLAEVVKYGLNSKCGLLVNASRSVIYAGNGNDFNIKAREQALIIQQEMASCLN